MSKFDLPNSASDPSAPDSDRVVLYAKGDEFYLRKSGGTVQRLAGSQILFGLGVPIGSLGNLGDVYVDSSMSGVYQKTGVSTWTFIGNFSGVTLADAAPPDIAAASALGSSAQAAKEDHTHGHGSQAGGTAHPNATTSVSGFESAADKTKLDGIAAGATANDTDAALRARASHTGSQLAATISDFSMAADARITLQKGAAGGLATLDGGGKVPTTQLPSFVDDVLEYADLASFPITGEAGKIYTAIDTGKIYRWTGSIYAEISSSVVLGSGTPASIGTATPGVSALGSREDHVHAHGNQLGGTLHANVIAAGTAGFMIGSDKTKLDGVATGATNTPLATVAPNNVTKSAAIIGVSTEAAKADHKHDITTSVASTIGTANSEGSATSLARSDHNHDHGAQTSGALHAAATTSVAGFLSTADKIKLDRLVNTKTDLLIEDDFASASELTRGIGKFGWANTSAGTGNNQTRIAGEAGRPGIFRLQGGTIASARSCINLGDAGMHCMLLGTGEILFEGMVRLSGTITAHLQSAIGLGDSFTANGDQANGIYIRILGTDTNWKLVSALGSVRSVVDLGVAYVTTNWVRLGYLVNTAGTSIQGMVNGVDFGSPIVTNIPTVAISPFVKTDAIAAGTALNFDTDKYYLKQTLAR